MAEDSLAVVVGIDNINPLAVHYISPVRVRSSLLR